MYALYIKIDFGFTVRPGFLNSYSAVYQKTSKFDYVMAYEKESDLMSKSPNLKIERVWQQSAIDDLKQAVRTSNVRMIESIMLKFNVFSGCPSCQFSDSELLDWTKIQLAKLEASKS